ncbi:MAG TPA: bifunctional (p)ppGpp synthetase/guanosine-3',5'-bis(diphosphate) 3'-pyrophosphohydrolase [Thermomicrobiales bacterium]|jgi:GTP pyrophosphokinase|nr:bifunctional (p)ppGpp synthetase/guanosine-3',5'-bis(diphosphate) 3'-pyrophosphohydrolase [Thermomicrobiales bacterium]
MPGTSKATLITDQSASDQDSQTPNLRPPVSLPAEHLIEAARSRLRTELAQHNLGDVPAIIERAVDRAIEWHAGQVRKSGEPYVVHPIEVAILLSRMSVDTEAIIAALLHDVVEDSAISLDTVRQEFGDRVALLVDGVTKLGQIQWTGDGDQATRERAVQAENLRKMFLAMIDDIGVVLIKLADRLHNMRTLDHMPRDKQIQIAQQTMEIYAPLANRLGIWQFKSELEDLAFRYLQPEAYTSIRISLEARGRDQASYIARVMQELKEAILAEGIDVELTGRTKHIYSVFRKMRQKQRTFDEIYDVIGIRCIIPNDHVKDCYGVLGVIHSMWHPIPGEFDDYIATPKQSMYQSLHTAVIGPEGHALEIQIRTQRMHEIAEFGVAAHWRYKEGKKADAKVEAKVAWLRQMLEWQAEMKDAEDFVETVKSDVLEEMIYVFTPKGDIIELPAGATPLDFAYRIHTEVGHHTVRAKVNDQLVRLDTKLKNGQVVEVSTSKTKLGPSRDWLREDLGYLTTASAKEKIRQWFRRQEREENLAQGKEILEKELRRLGVELKPEDIHKHFPRYNKVEDMIAAIGYGAISPQLIASRLGENETKNVLSDTPHVPKPRVPLRLDVMGVGDLLTSLATCCKPVNGDAIVGYVTRGRGITVHRADCSNLVNLPDPERLIQVTWGSKAGETYPVNIMVRAWDRVGLLKDISTLLADEKVNILYVQTVTNDDRTVSLRITIEVENVSQLSRVLHKIESVPAVDEVRRDTSNGSSATRLAGD